MVGLRAGWREQGGIRISFIDTETKNRTWTEECSDIVER